ncbi:MAG: 4-hydroxythreonine-4-phosphate dehydrogenase PdxA, partial [Clostridiales bacterium]|nr:4-hydroxythreonine-4-phosphate dehydrogenase PdxA [Clostridiales bacterium]
MKPIIGITMGDPAGIGAEITMKTLAKKEIYENCNPLVIGDYEALLDANRFCGTGLRVHRIHTVSEAQNEWGTVDLIDLGFLVPGSW